MTQEEYRNAVQSCRDGVRKAKANVELNLERYEKGIKQDSTNMYHLNILFYYNN